MAKPREDRERPLEITVREDPVSGTWTFTLQGHEVEVEKEHGFVKIDGQVYEAEAVKGLTDVEDLRGEPLEAIQHIVHRHEVNQTPPDKPPQAYEGSNHALEAEAGGEEQATSERDDEQAKPAAKAPALKETFSTEEAGEFLHLSPKTLETMRSRGGGPPYVKFGRRVIYRRKDLEEWLAERVRHSTS